MSGAWRYLRVALLLVLELAGVGAAAAFAPRALAGANGDVKAVASPLLSVAAAVLVYVVLARGVERRPPTELAGERPLAELAVGLAAGAALFTITIGLIALGGGYHVTAVGSPWALVPPLGMALVSGVVEELLMRGILFRLLEDLFGSWAALTLSAALFGLTHAGNPHATWVSSLAIAVEAGTLLGAAYMTTRRLWLAIGIHAAWNWTQGAVFGVAVSGTAIRGWLVSEPRGPAWLSGGEFGAEASIVAMLVCGTAAGLLLRGALHKSPAVAPAWARARQRPAAA